MADCTRAAKPKVPPVTGNAQSPAGATGSKEPKGKGKGQDKGKGQQKQTPRVNAVDGGATSTTPSPQVAKAAASIFSKVVAGELNVGDLTQQIRRPSACGYQDLM